VRSLPEFFIIAVLVTITPGPGTAMVVRVTACDGRAAARKAILGNCVGVLTWGVLSAVGVSSLIVASQSAYDVLRTVGAIVLVVMGARSLGARRRSGQHTAETKDAQPAYRRQAGLRTGLVTSMANPKLAVFFVALLPQFLTRGSPVLPYAMAMAVAVVALDLAWYSVLSYAIDKARNLLRPRVQQTLEQITGTVMIGLGIHLALASG
jgi:threonine/homoserine/homoserine lactone efflux protein